MCLDWVLLEGDGRAVPSQKVGLEPKKLGSSGGTKNLVPPTVFLENAPSRHDVVPMPLSPVSSATLTPKGPKPGKARGRQPVAKQGGYLIKWGAHAAVTITNLNQSICGGPSCLLFCAQLPSSRL